MLYDPKWEAPLKTALIAARAMISGPNSWCAQYADGKGGICAVHALQRAIFGRHQERRGEPGARTMEAEALLALGKAMGIADPGTGVSEGQWNDAHTQAEVLAAFDRAIASL